MTPRDCFGLIVRTLGLLGLAASFYYLVPFLLILASYGQNLGVFPVIPSLVIGVLYILASVYLLCGAPHLVDFCYPPTTPSKTLPTARESRADLRIGS